VYRAARVFGIAARLRAGRFRVQFSAEAKDLSLMHYVSNRSGARSVSYSVVTRGSSTGGETAGT